MRCKRGDDKPATSTAGEVFPDGLLELVRAPGGELSLLHWDGQAATTAAQFTRHGKTFAPVQIDQSVLLPRGVVDHDSTRKLFVEILDFVSRTIPGALDVAKLVTYFVFATWLADALPMAPTLWIVCPPTAVPGPLFQVLQLICRRSLVLNDVSALEFYSAADRLTPTVLREVVHPTRAFLNQLRASARRDACTVSGGRFLHPYCAKIIFAPAPLRDPACAGFPLEVVLPAAADYVPRKSVEEAARLAALCQAKLLNYRLSNLAKVHTPKFDLTQFTPCVRDLAYSLGACIVEDDQLQAEIVTLLKPLDSETRVGHASTLDAIVLEALLAHCHAHTGKFCAVMEVMRDVNTLLTGRAEALTVSPESIGWVLRGLGLHTDFVPGGRKGLILTQDVREQIHNLAARYGVRTLREPSATIQCVTCAALNVLWKTETNPASKIA